MHRETRSTKENDRPWGPVASEAGLVVCGLDGDGGVVELVGGDIGGRLREGLLIGGRGGGGGGGQPGAHRRRRWAHIGASSRVALGVE